MTRQRTVVMMLQVSLFSLLLSLAGPAIYGSENEISAVKHRSPHGPHHVSVLAADTNVEGEGDNATLGVDYEFRLNSLLGVGAVVERAFGEIDATTALVVADIHVWEGLCAQVGPGVEHKSLEDVLVARLGVLYEIEFSNFTLSPQLHWDYHDGEENAVVAGFAFGFSF